MSTAAAQVEPRRMSLEEWASLPEDEPGELVDGQLAEEELADWDHEDVVAWLLLFLGPGSPLAAAASTASEGKYAVASRPRPQGRPLRVLRRNAAPAAPWTEHDARPTSSSRSSPATARDARRDRIDKAQEYAAFGARFYWLIDPDDRTFEIFELQAGARYLRVRAAAEGTLDVPGCTGLRLDLDALWAQVERLA